MTRLDLVPIHTLSLEIPIGLVQAQAVCAGNEALRLQDVLTQLLDRAGTTGIVTRHLNTTGQ